MDLQRAMDLPVHSDEILARCLASLQLIGVNATGMEPLKPPIVVYLNVDGEII